MATVQVMSLWEVMPVELWVMTCRQWLPTLRDRVSFSATCRLARHLVRHHCSDMVPPLMLLPKQAWLAIGRMMKVDDLVRLGATCRVMRRWVKLFVTRHLPPITHEGPVATRPGRHLERAWLVLADGVLMVYLTQPFVRETPLKQIPLDKKTTLKLVCCPYAAGFQVTTSQGGSKFYFPGARPAKKRWMRTIRLAVMQIAAYDHDDPGIHRVAKANQ